MSSWISFAAIPIAAKTSTVSFASIYAEMRDRIAVHRCLLDAINAIILNAEKTK